MNIKLRINDCLFNLNDNQFKVKIIYYSIMDDILKLMNTSTEWYDICGNNREILLGLFHKAHSVSSINVYLKYDSIAYKYKFIMPMVLSNTLILNIDMAYGETQPIIRINNNRASYVETMNLYSIYRFCCNLGDIEASLDDLDNDVDSDSLCTIL